MTYRQIKPPVHFIGIGGIGMSGIAGLFLRRGLAVSGSDLKESGIVSDLKKMGATVYIGHNAAHVRTAATVVYSTAIGLNNPEMQAAKKRKIPILRRAQAMAALMEEKSVITVTGSHGKTTTTSLASYLLLEAGLSPSVAIGGILKNIDTNACMGKGSFFVAEADESDGSFLYYRPDFSIITNIDREHLDYYRTFRNEVNFFRKFINQTKSGGCVFACADDRNIARIMQSYKRKHTLFGLTPTAGVYPRNIALHGLESEFDTFAGKKFISRFHLSLGGMHNISNALAVIALGLELGIDTSVIRRALSTYQGAGRRIEVKFKNRDYLVIDDYAHHPTEIRATLSAIGSMQPNRLIVVFQPHRYTRTKLLLDEFTACFDNADCVIVTDIYPASERPIVGVTGELLADSIRERLAKRDILFLPKARIISHIVSIMQPRDVIVTLGAGDIAKTCDELVERIKRQR